MAYQVSIAIFRGYLSYEQNNYLVVWKQIELSTDILPYWFILFNLKKVHFITNFSFLIDTLSRSLKLNHPIYKRLASWNSFYDSSSVLEAVQVLVENI